MQQTHIRAMADADLCHIKWNVIKNAMNSVGLDMAALKLTITCPPAALTSLAASVDLGYLHDSGYLSLLL